MRLAELKKKIRLLSDKEIAETSKWFFKTGKGEYGEKSTYNVCKLPSAFLNFTLDTIASRK